MEIQSVSWSLNIIYGLFPSKGLHITADGSLFLQGSFTLIITLRSVVLSFCYFHLTLRKSQVSSRYLRLLNFCCLKYEVSDLKYRLSSCLWRFSDACRVAFVLQWSGRYWQLFSLERTRRSGLRCKVLHTLDAGGKMFCKNYLGLLAKQGTPLRLSKHGTVSLQMKF